MAKNRRNENTVEWRRLLVERLKDRGAVTRIARRIGAPPSAITAILHGRVGTSKWIRPLSEALGLPEPKHAISDFPYNDKPVPGERLALALAVVALRQPLREALDALDVASKHLTSDEAQACGDALSDVDESIKKARDAFEVAWNHSNGWTYKFDPRPRPRQQPEAVKRAR